MNLKRMPFWFILFFSLSITASAQQATKADIEALATKVSSIEKTVNKIDQRLITVEKTVNDMDKRLISLEIIVKEMDKRITVRINVLFWAMGTLIGVVLATITLQVLGFLQSKRERAEIQQQIRDQRAET
ncbi:hypothetical protein IH992_11410 [Candidatus Poribacteria bacterium]|nr:hypothetical protein [Candidatus Poribacteria bacterium]